MSYFLYFVFFGLVLFLAGIYERVRTSGYINFFILFVIWLLLVLFSSLRFDVGNDYHNYVLIINDFAYGVSTPDLDKILFFWFSKLFSYSDYPYLGVFLVYFALTSALILKVIKSNNVVFLGLFTFFCFGLYFDALDRIRQYVALAIFLYAINDIVRGCFASYSFKILIAALFHPSAIILLPVFFIARVPVNNFSLGFIFFGLIILHFIGAGEYFVTLLYELVPFYSDRYRDTSYAMEVDAGINTGLGVLARMVFLMIVVAFSARFPVYRNILLMGLVLYSLFPGNLNIARISSYFTSVVIILFPFFVNRYYKGISGFLLVFPMILFLCFILQRNLSSEYLQYQTVFSDSFDQQRFKVRIYE